MQTVGLLKQPFLLDFKLTALFCGESKMSLLSHRHAVMKLVCSMKGASSAQKLHLGKALQQFSSEANRSEHEKWEKGGGMVHKLAEVHTSAVIELGAVVQANAIVGVNVHIGAGSIVGPHVNIGSDTLLGFNVALQNCSLGTSCIIHNGVCIGQDGFGFTVNEMGEVVKKPQLLTVQIGNFVEIGANSCIDRGSWRDTIIGDHTKIDNQVQIGHNVVIGRCCMLCGQVGLGGSATLGDYVVLGGKAGVADHVTIASKVRVAAKSGVMSDLKQAGDYAGFPAVPAQEWRRSTVALRRLGRQSSISNLVQTDSFPADSRRDKVG
ncbi:hypothetical protein O6H91_21G039000 [Diphasiastrum complanatum]|uniref:Uncharacterized protein n=2 Tax=Diphasiastrum complanatum TaxID=34168 RepID=A0ACC2AJM2_DIPCM|nr:hypothetical protein O6H91_Y181000 [Diphasiastrum complanatum]KAJ7517755.1 hypothetical protein O6H91_21G039000 [Diphasiastrum complanatum]